MKKSLLLLSASFSMIAATLSAQYSNASWSGAWIASNGSTVQNYVIFDGAGSITEAGVPGASGSQGSYSIQANGSVSGTIVYSGFPLSFTGSFTNDSTTSISVMGNPLTFNKIKNAAVMEGTYDGTIIQTTGGSATLPINFVVDANGNVTSSTNLTGPVSGKVFYSNGKVTGLIKSGEASPFTEIEINLSAYSGSTSLAGAAVLTGSGNAGTFSLTKSATVSVKTISSIQFSAYPNPAKDQLVIEGNISSGTLKVYDILGNEVMNTTIISSKTVLNVNSLNKGVYFYNITSAGSSAKAGKFIVE